MSTTPNMNLTLWDQLDDPYDHGQLANNFSAIDTHDHTSSKGKRIVTASLADGVVTDPKLASNAVTPTKIQNNAVTNLKMADDSVDPRVIAPGAVGTPELADRSVTSMKLAEEIRPLGEVMMWWRPSIAQPLPDNWVACDGSSLTAPDHDFAGGGTVNLPDMRNKFVLGAATGGTGTGPTTPPAIGQQGGTNLANLSHTHSVPHAHSVALPSLSVGSHSHTVVSHTHGLNSHSHTVDSHSHTVSAHTHPVDAHSHAYNHNHSLPDHAHDIALDGFHAHTFAGGTVVNSRRGYIYPTAVGSAEDRQTLYLGGFNAGGTSVPAPMDGAGGHTHGGTNQGGSGVTGVEGSGGTSASGSTASANSLLASGNASPSTNASSGTTQASTPSTSAATPSTVAATASTSTDSPVSGAGLTTQDIRPAYVGLLFLMKVKN